MSAQTPNQCLLRPTGNRAKRSDTQSKRLGNMEQSIAVMFRPATANGEVPLPVEIDSFQWDCRGAVHPREMTLESTPGVLFALTHPVDDPTKPRCAVSLSKSGSNLWPHSRGFL